MESRPPNMAKRLSQGSLHQLERNAGDFASSQHSRIHNWVRTLQRGMTVVGDSLADPSLFHGGFNSTTQYFPGFGQLSNIENAGTQASPNLISNNTVRPEFTSHSTVVHPQPRSMSQLDPTGNAHLPSKNVPPKMPYKATSSGAGPTFQPPSKKVFTETHFQAASTAANIKSIISVDDDANPVAAKPSSQNASISAPTVERKTRNQKKDCQLPEFRTKIEAVFPDICEKYVTELYTKYQPVIDSEEEMTVAIEQALEDILEQPSYPKKVQRKRKQMADSVDDIDVQKVRSDHTYYFPVVVKILQKQFTFIPNKTIKALVTQNKTLYSTYIALCQIGQPDSDANDYWTRLHRAKDKHPRRFAAVLEHELHLAKDAIAAKEDAKRKENEKREEKTNEEKHRLAGTLVECQCCFGEVPSNRVVPCEGDQVHMFCNSCIRTRAETQVGMMHYEMKCFDLSGCQALFDSKNVRVVLGDKLMKKLEDLQQNDEIAKASIDGLEECPFCDFKAICSPVEQDKEFNCLNPECEKVSCRLCKEKTHIPLSCKEAKEGQLGRHAVEEAMTAALIRKCPKCTLPIIKEEGCNKVRCERCNTCICDVCKQEIPQTGYDHFSNGGCQLHEKDTGAKRRMDEVAQAEKAAMDSIIAKDGDINPKLLRVSKPVSQSKAQPPASRPLPQYRVWPAPIPQIPQMPPVRVPQIPPAPLPARPVRPIHHIPRQGLFSQRPLPNFDSAAAANLQTQPNQPNQHQYQHQHKTTLGRPTRHLFSPP